MISSVGIKQKLFRIAEIVHLRIFGHEMGEEMRNFLNHLSWSFFGGIIAAWLMFVVTILAGRLLGPEEYGKYNAVLSFATILSILYLFGMDISSVRYLSDKKFSNSEKKIFTTTFFVVLFMQCIVTILLLIWHRFFLMGIPVPENLFIFGILFAIVISLKTLVNGFLRAFHEYKKQSIYRILDAGFVLSSFIAIVLIYQRQVASSYILSFMFGGVFFISFSFLVLRQYFSKFDFSILKKIFYEYNRHLLIMSFIGVVLVSDKLVIGKLLGFEVLGYYGAYYASSHLFVSEIGGIFMNVFWPSVIKNEESMLEIVRKLTKLFIFYSPIWVIFISFSTFILFLFFGSAYSIRYDYIILFSMSAFFGYMFSIFVSFLNINHIRKSIFMVGIFTSCSLLSLLVSKNIGVYVFVQILLQIVLIYHIRATLLKYEYEKI